MTMKLGLKVAPANLILMRLARVRLKKLASTQQGDEAGFHLQSLRRQISSLKLMASIRQLGRFKDILIISLILK